MNPLLLQANPRVRNVKGLVLWQLMLWVSLIYLLIRYDLTFTKIWDAPKEKPIKVMPGPTSTRPANGTSTVRLVKKKDYIYRKGWDTAPIVLESRKLVFFAIPKVGCTVFKQLWRRVEGFENWNVHGGKGLPHNPFRNGLTYLWDYSLEEANTIMTHPNWTRAIFVRNPQDRLLSAFLDKAIHKNGTYLQNHCCPSCNHVTTLDDFLDLMQSCVDPHWLPQYLRMDEKYWPFINFVGNFDNVHNDTKRLLQRVGAWEPYGSAGWGLDGKEEIFGSTKTKHYTGADKLHEQYYTPEVEARVRKVYAVDYENDVFSHFYQDSKL